MAEQIDAVVDATLTMIADRPMTKAGHVGCVMRHVSGHDENSQWFDFRPGFYTDITRVQWDNGTMGALLPADTAEILVRNGYARYMTAAEADAHNRELKEEVADVGKELKDQPTAQISESVDASGGEPAGRVESPPPVSDRSRRKGDKS